MGALRRRVENPLRENNKIMLFSNVLYSHEIQHRQKSSRIITNLLHILKHIPIIFFFSSIHFAAFAFSSISTALLYAPRS